jgi:hypothetical protein
LQTGNSGKFLTTNGSTSSWGTVSAGAASTLLGGASGSLPYQSALDTTSMLAAGTSSQVLVSGSSPSWTNTPTLTGTNFSGTAASLVAGSATSLQTARTTNGTSFDGTANITVTAAAGTLTGTTLNSSVVSSSLTSVGTLASLAVTGNVTSADPTTSSQLTTKSYVDNAVNGLSWKTPARVATTGNITLSGTQTIDAIAVIAGDRVLVKNQSTTTQNGVYVVAAGAWARSTDMDGNPSVGEVNGAAIFVTDGTVGADTAWTQTATIVTVGTQSMVFVMFSSSGSTNANALTGTTLAAGVVSSSLTSVGTITAGTWAGTAITADHGGSGATTLTGYLKGNGTSAFTAAATVPASDISGTTLASSVVTSSLTTVAADVTDGTYALGWKIIPQNSQSAAYTLVLADSGKQIFHPAADTTARTYTIPANATVAYPVGTAVTFINQNAGGVITIAITTDTMRLAGAGTTGSRTLAANGVATAIKITSTEWIISGTGLT